MGRILNLKERLYWEIYDADFVSQANASVSQQRTLFAGANQSKFMLSNMQVAGQLPSANTAAVLAMGYTPIFFTIRSTPPAAGAARTGVSMTAGDVQWNRETWELFRKQALATFNIDVKPVWQGHVDQLPAGHGTHGYGMVSSSGLSTTTDLGQLIQNNGMPTPDALLRFAKPIIISSQQAFSVVLQNAVQFTTGGTAPPDALNWLNAGNPSGGIDYKAAFVHLYMLLLRDVL